MTNTNTKNNDIKRLTDMLEKQQETIDQLSEQVRGLIEVRNLVIHPDDIATRHSLSLSERVEMLEVSQPDSGVIDVW